MARLWQCGFELGSLSPTGLEVTTQSGTASIQSTFARAGTYALRVNPTASTGFVRYHVFATDQAADGYQSVALRIDTLPSASTTILRFAEAVAPNDPRAQMRLTTVGKLQLWDAAGAQIGVDSDTLTSGDGSWNVIELRNNATGTGAIEGRLNGVTFASGANSLQGLWSRIVAGVMGTNCTCDLYFDDWKINDASGSSQTGYPGGGRIIHLRPNAAGDANTWSVTNNTAGGTSNFTLVDEVPPNDTTDLVQSGTLNNEDFYNLTDSGIGSGDTVNCVLVGLRLRNNTADASAAVKAEIKKASGGTIAQGAAVVPNSASFATNQPVEPRNYTLAAYKDPDGATWTQSTLDSMQAGIKLTAAGTNRIQVTSLWVSVDYTPSSGSGATVTPPAVAAVAAVPTASVSAGANASPASVAAVAAVPAPSVSANSNATVSPSAVGVVAAVLAPGVATSAAVTTVTVTATAAAPALGVSSSSTLAPAPVAATASVLAPSLASSSGTTTALVAAVTALPAPSIATDSTITVGTVSASAAVPAADVSAASHATAAPSTVTAVAQLSAPSVAAGGNATVQPGTVTASAAFPSLALASSADVSPAAVAASATVLGAAASAGATASPDTVQTAVSVLSVDMSAGTSLAPAPVAAAVVLLAPALTAGATTAPAAVAAVVDIPAPDVAVHAFTAPATITATAALPTPDLVTALTVQAAVITAVAAVPTPTVTAHTTRDITVTAGPLSIGWAAGELATGWSAGPLSA